MYEVLFICSGNICRSPYAEGYLRHRLGADAAACSRSAGTLGIHGEAPSSETLELAREGGFEASELRSKAITYDGVDEADLILVMEDHHRRALLERFPEVAGKLHLLSEYHPEVKAADRAPNIFDPIGLPMEEYRRCFALVRDSIDGLLATGTVPTSDARHGR